MKWLTQRIIVLILILFTCPALAAPTSCPNYPVPEDMYWQRNGQPSGELAAVTYYEGIQGVYCYYQNPQGLILGFLRSKFPVMGPDGADWVRVTPCPLEKACYVCKKISENSCHFRS